jgi:hypothetical protein
MRGSLLLGALALSAWGGAALADGPQTSAEPPQAGRDVPAAQERPAAPPAAVQQEPMPPVEERWRPPVVRVSAGGGFESYTGGLNDTLTAGFAWGVQMAFQPLRYAGLEFGYSGAANEMDDQALNVNGADVVRSGVDMLVTVGLGTKVEPYLLAGIGANWYNFRNAVADDSNGNVPLGGGVRGNFGRLYADARFDYNVMFADDLGFPFVANTGGGRLQGLLSIGGNW